MNSQHPNSEEKKSDYMKNTFEVYRKSASYTYSRLVNVSVVETTYNLFLLLVNSPKSV